MPTYAVIQGAELSQEIMTAQHNNETTVPCISLVPPVTCHDHKLLNQKGKRDKSIFHERPYLLKLLKYVEDPLKHAEKITDPELGSFRFRIGDYRVIFDLEADNVVVLRVGHRRDIYRK